MKSASGWGTCSICERRFLLKGATPDPICKKCAREMAAPPAPMRGGELNKLLANYLALGGAPSGAVGIVRAHKAWREENGLPPLITEDMLEVR